MSKTDIKPLFETMEYGPAPESRAPADDWLQSQKTSFDLFIGGQWVKGGGKPFYTYNPATGERLAKIATANAKDVDKAVRAAARAQKTWHGEGGPARAKVLYALARLIQKHARILAVLETLDNGKPIRESRDADIPLAARHFYYHAGWAQIFETELDGYEPHGVVGQIIPWNFPFLMLAWKIAPALAAGNTVVLKPAEQTPLTALYFAGLCAQAGVPDGVINIITGDGDTGKAIVAQNEIAKIAFTGSTEVGKYIREQTAGTGKSLTLELGGKSPFIVFSDADLDSAVEGIVNAIWFNQGEVCCAGSRLLVEEAVAERFYKKLTRRMKTLRAGDPLDKAIDMGALVDQTQVKRVEGYIKTGKDEGGRVEQFGGVLPTKGCFVAPTLITDVHPASTVVQEEIFGPVLVAMTFRTPAEAVQIANNTRYGLAASVWSENINVALDIASQIKAGVVWVNATNQFDASVGFGGYRESGYGREGGPEGMAAYVRPKKKTAAITAVKMIKPVPGKVDVNDIDRTPKNFIGGAQKRPDASGVMPVCAPDGTLIGEVGNGNRKDIRNAVEAAAKAAGWSRSTAHNRAQILYYIAENLNARSDEFTARLRLQTGATVTSARKEVRAAIERLFACAAYADKFEGSVHSPPMREIAIAMKEPLGILGIVAPQQAPLLGFVSVMAAAIATGNRAVIVPSNIHPLSATDFYQVLETSDVPAGVVNIVTGDQFALSETLAAHHEVDGLWYFGAAGGTQQVEFLSTGNLKQTWGHQEREINWHTLPVRRLFEHATQVKNIWVPYGA